ncbi:recombination protein NinG [Flavobacteriaceae bacterium]|nr:recombination protein NinG [Flavobacteriaceae bacterium]
MAKKSTRKKLVDKLDKVFSIYIRRRYADNDIAECFTCGKQDHWKKLQNGHFQSRKHYATRWHELNCQTQCAGCNVFRYGEQFKFARNLDNTYYDGLADELHIEANKTVKLDNTDLEMLIEKYEMLIKQLEN